MKSQFILQPSRKPRRYRISRPPDLVYSIIVELIVTYHSTSPLCQPGDDFLFFLGMTDFVREPAAGNRNRRNVQRKCANGELKPAKEHQTDCNPRRANEN